MVSFLVLCAIGTISAQRSVKRQIDRFYDRGLYAEALPMFDDLSRLDSDAKYLRMYARVLYEARVSGLAVDTYKQLFLVGDSPLGDDLLYYAKSLHSIASYEEAAEAYKAYLGHKDRDEDHVVNVMQLIEACSFGLKTAYRPEKAFIENMGMVVNSPRDEVMPVISPTQSDKYYFSSNRAGSAGGRRNEQGLKDHDYGSYYHDMYAVSAQDGGWSTLSAVDPLLNTSAAELLLDFSVDGSVLYFTKEAATQRPVVLVDTFSVDRDIAEYPDLFESPLVTSIGDLHMRLINDQAIIFASNREGGFGGYDLYLSVLDGANWSIPLNLGPTVNSPYDELCPYMTSDGRHLYYSSDRVGGLGGYDVFYQSFSPESREWGISTNLNHPINSPDDDLYFSVESSGQKGVFSSNRPGGYGGFDLYLVYVKDPSQTLGINFSIDNYVWNEEDNQSAIMAASDQSAISIETPEVLGKEVVLAPISYETEVEYASTSNRKTIRSLVDVLSIYPDTRLILRGYTPDIGSADRELFFSVKQLERIEQDMISSGVDASRITLLGVGGSGSNRSVIEPIVVKGQSDIGLYISYSSKYKLPIVSSDLGYRVRLLESTQMYNIPAVLEQASMHIERLSGEQRYTYYTAPVGTYKEAKALRLQLWQEGYSEATIVPQFGLFNISIAQAEELSLRFADLQLYLQDLR